MENSLLNHFLQSELLSHFTIVSIQELGDVASKELFYEISLEENHVIPTHYAAGNYESKGFYPETNGRSYGMELFG